jgi:hypothetical protein
MDGWMMDGWMDGSIDGLIQRSLVPGTELLTSRVSIQISLKLKKWLSKVSFYKVKT